MSSSPERPLPPVQLSSPQHLAKITPIDPRRSMRVLSTLSLLGHSLLLVAFQVAWILPILAGMMLTNHGRLIGLAVILLSPLWLCMQVALVFLYPEWPLNLLLCWRLRQSIRLRDDPIVSPWNESFRVVELVPQERQRRMALDTATDLMLIRIDDQGVWMTGDESEYELPRESILSAEVQSVRPAGWFTATHMVVVYVRTADGPIELPISYRDHSLGSLRSSARRVDAQELAEQINAIAVGQHYLPPLETANHRPQPSSNPYAPPAAI